jgi:cytochrome P450
METTQLELPRYDPADGSSLRDPYPEYAKYRSLDPIHWGVSSMAELPGSWYLFRYDHNSAVLSDAAVYASDPASVGMTSHVPEAFRPIAEIHQRWLGGMDEPDHRRLRAIMAKAFTPRRINALEPRIAAITTSLVNDALAAGDGRVDIINDIAFPLPMAVVGDALGVPEEDWTLFQGWAADISHAVDKAGDVAAGAAGAAAILGMYDYFAGLVSARRSNPGDDLLSSMVAAADDDGLPMSEFDAISIATELGVAGHETTTNGVAKSIIGMLTQPESWAAFKSVSGDSLDGAIDELLRWSTPVQRQRWRWVTKQTQLGDRVLSYGDSVVSILAAANRDPEEFPNPDRIRFDRPSGRHLTFGFGPHFCLGSNLARLEMKIALQQIAMAMPDMQLVAAAEDIPWRDNSIIPGPAELLVRA